MKFNLLVFINLAAVISTGSSNTSLYSYSLEPLPVNCTSFVKESVKYFNSSEVSEEKPSIEFIEDAVPYVYLISLDVATEFCKVPDRFKKVDQLNKTKSVCPMDYSLKSSNLKINITKGLEYMSNLVNCTTVCHLNRKVYDVCQFIAFANNIIKEESAGGSVHIMKEDKKQSQDLLKNDNKNTLTQSVNISQVTKSSFQTKQKLLPKVTAGSVVQSVVNDKSDTLTPVLKTDSVLTSEKPSGNSDIKINGENKKTNPQIFIKTLSNNNKNVNEKFGVNKAVTDPVPKNNDNVSKKLNEMNKSQLLLNGENTDIPETESALTDNLYPSKNDQNNNNNNIVNNNNNNNNEYGDDPGLKTPHEEGDDDDDDNNVEDLDKSNLQDSLPDREPQFAKSSDPKEIYSGDNFFQAEDSHFSVYFLTTVSVIIIGYVIYHNKKKIVAYALEGRRNRNGRRRPTSASYRKLDCNLEEAITSNPSNTSVTNVVY